LQEAINKDIIPMLRSLLRLIVGPIASRSSRHTLVLPELVLPELL
jgi:hypothetical protein